MSRPPFEVADVFRSYGEAYRQAQSAGIPQSHERVMRAIVACRTAELGGHVDTCSNCGAQEISYNSCRNRHCPKCQSEAKARWLQARQAELLPVGYFHVVFTLPEEIAKIGLQNKRLVYDLLFKATAKALQTVAADPKYLGATIGFLAVLHTWGQALTLHPHLHCVVPAGGFDRSGQKWIPCRPRFFLPVRVLSRQFRRIFLAELLKAFQDGQLHFYEELAQLEQPQHYAAWIKKAKRQEWVVYAKKPFGGPGQVLDYLGRYTHRVAIANHRITSVGDGKVTFRWRNYRRHRQNQLMTLDATEFIRRFLLHVLPDHFVRIRYYGFLANRNRIQNVERARRLLEPDQVEPAADAHAPAVEPETLEQPLTQEPRLCPKCRIGRRLWRENVPSRQARAGPIKENDSS